MRILIVCSGNTPGFNFEKHQAFVFDQVQALKNVDIDLEFDYFFIKGKGISGYLSCLKELKAVLKQTTYHLIHAHVGTSGFLANLQRDVPVITTFHGADINYWQLKPLSLVVELLSRRTIYISQNLVDGAIYTDKNKLAIIPCGVNFDLFIPRSKAQSRSMLRLSPDVRYILFSSSFNFVRKNFPLAKAAVDMLADCNVELLELKNYTRQEVALLFTAVDVALMTSFSEGSPQFVKEALACNCPVVSTDAGDVRSFMATIPGCFISSYETADVADKLRQALALTGPIDAKQHIQRFDNRVIAQQIYSIYQQCCIH